MNCPYCGNDKTKVIATANTPDRVSRVRECLKCRERFTTVELLAQGTFHLNDDAIKLWKSTQDQLLAAYNALGKIMRSWKL